MENLEEEKSENPPGKNNKYSHHVLNSHKADRKNTLNDSQSPERKQAEREFRADDDASASTTKRDLTDINLYMNLVIRTLTILHSLKLTPLQWNKKRKRIQITDSRLNYSIWIATVQAMTVTAIYATWRMMQEIFDPTPTFEGYKLILYGMYYLIILMVVVYDFTFIFKARETVQLFNSYIAMEFAFADFLMAKRRKFDEEDMKAFKKFRRTLLSMTIAGLSGGSVTPLSAIFSTSDVDPLRRFVMEHFPPEFIDSPWILGFFVLCMYNLLFHIISASLIGAMSSMVFGMRIKYYQKFVLVEDKNEMLLNDPLTAIKMHTYMQYIMKCINMWGEYLVPLILLIGNVIHTFAMYGSLMLHSVIPMPGYLFFPIVSINFGVFELFIIPIVASVFEGSVEAQNVWSSKPSEKWLTKKIRTMFPFGFRAGMFFTVKRETASTFLSTAVNNTIDLSLGVKI